MYAFALFILFCVCFAKTPAITDFLMSLADPEKKQRQKKEPFDLLALLLKLGRGLFSLLRDLCSMFIDLSRARNPGYGPAQPRQAPAEQTPSEAAELPVEATVEGVQNWTRALSDSLRVSSLGLADQELSQALEQMARSLDLLAENAQLDPRDLPATLRFLDRYGATTEKLANSYWRMERATDTGPQLRRSMEQIKAMLQDLAPAYERFRLSLYENDMLSAAAQVELARSLLAQDGLDGPSPFAATEIMESGGT